MNTHVFPANRPDGKWIDWRIGSGRFEVAGTEHRSDDVLNFLDKVGKAWGAKGAFGGVLENDPDNPYRVNAIRVAGLIGDDRNPTQRFHLGYAPRATADKVERLHGETPIAAEPKQAKIEETRIFISIAGLVPKETPKEK